MIAMIAGLNLGFYDQIRGLKRYELRLNKWQLFIWFLTTPYPFFYTLEDMFIRQKVTLVP